MISFASYSLWELRRKTQEQVASSATFTVAGVSVATLAEVAAPGTWIYRITIAGPILAEGRVRGYGHVAPFFVGGLLGYYGAAVFSTWLMAWGAGLHKGFKQNLFLVANILLLVAGHLLPGARLPGIASARQAEIALSPQVKGSKQIREPD